MWVFLRITAMEQAPLSGYKSQEDGVSLSANMLIKKSSGPRWSGEKSEEVVCKEPAPLIQTELTHQ